MAAENLNDVDLGQLVVRMDDEQGIHCSIGFTIVDSWNRRPALLGVMLEIAARKLSTGKQRRVIEEWRSRYDPMPGEVAALRHLESNGTLRAKG